VGKKAIEDAGVEQVSCIPIGVDSSVWTPMLDEGMEKTARKALGFADDDYIVITVADNQERKNLSAAFEIVAKAREKIPNLKYILVSRQFQPTGWRLYDMANYYKINDIFSLYERGMPANDLALLYSVSNVFLLTSKAEGLGIPVLEAMACGIPFLVSNTGALPQLASNDRGWIIPLALENIDVWGNSLRGYVDTKKGADVLVHMYNSPEEVSVRASRAYEYIHEDRTWAGCVKHFMEELGKLK
jgi:glycosyltransferase involved in cell wall biosynthesis